MKRRANQAPAASPRIGLGQPSASGPPSVQQLLRADQGATQRDALVASHWFDAGADGQSRSVTIRFSGHRVGGQGTAGLRDTFVQNETVEGIMPGSGPLSVTTKAYGIEPGTWSVAAEVILPSPAARPAWLPTRGRPKSGRPASPAAWSWRRWALDTSANGVVTTRRWPVVRLAGGPAVLPGSWTALATVGVLATLTVQAALLARENVAVGPALLASSLALFFGLGGAKLWYAALHPGEPILEGWAVDGFLVVAPIVAAVVLLAFGLPIGIYLDASTPGIFLAVAIGRVGCFLAGCCAGRLSASRWAVWSSDRRVGGRRIPAPLLESSLGAALAIATLVLVLGAERLPHGLIFVVAAGAYALGRQLLLRLRAEQRASPKSLQFTGAAAALSLVAVIVIVVAQGNV